MNHIFTVILFCGSLQIFSNFLSSLKRGGCGKNGSTVAVSISYNYKASFFLLQSFLLNEATRKHLFFSLLLLLLLVLVDSFLTVQLVFKTRN